MATRGVFQCRKLILRYCEHGGSSRAVREYLASGRLLDWAAERPTVQIQVRVRNGKHPNLEGEYATQAVSNKTALNGVQSRPVVHQVCLRSKGISEAEQAKRRLPSHKRVIEEKKGDEASAPQQWWKHPVEAALDKLYNKSGRKMTKFTKPIYTDTPSIQGVWTPSLDLHRIPAEDDFEMSIVEAK